MGGRSHRWLLAALLAVLAVMALRLWVVEPLKVETDSMSPTLQPGQHVLSWKPGAADRTWERGEIAVVDRPTGPPLVKRVVAVAGDTVGLADGQLVLNGTVVEEEYADPAAIDGTYKAPVRVPAGHVYVMGDERSGSVDSRRFGPVPVSDLEGRMLAVVWPPTAVADGAVGELVEEPDAWAPYVRGALDVGLLGALGALLLAGWLLPGAAAGREARGPRLLVSAGAVRAGGRWALLVALAAVLMFAAEVAEIIERPAVAVLGSADWWSFGMRRVPEARAYALLAVAALAVAVACRLSWTRARAVRLRVVAVALAAAVVPLVASGHAAATGHHVLASLSLVVHVLAIAAWAGGLLAVVLHVRRQPALLAAVLPRFSRLALVCFAGVALSGLVAAWTRVGVGSDVLTSEYGALLAVKVSLLTSLGALGWWHRRRSIAAVAAGRPRAFAVAATVELGLMGAAVTVALMLDRAEEPALLALRTRPEHAAPYSAIDPELDRLDPLQLVTSLRPDVPAVTFAVAVLAVLVWLLAGRACSGLRAGWPMSRRVRLVAGTLLALWASVGGLGAYATSTVSLRLVQVAVLAVVAPALVVAGLPSLPSRLGRVRLVDASLGWALLVVLSGLGPLLGWALPYRQGDLLLGLAWFGAGVLVCAAVRRAPTGAPEVTLARVVVLVALGLHLRAAVAAPGAYADGWFARSHWWWQPPLMDRDGVLLAAVVAGAAAAAAVLSLRAAGTRSDLPEPELEPEPAPEPELEPGDERGALSTR